MGKRKSRSSKLAAKPKKAPKLNTAFDCPFCNHTGSVECSIDLKGGVAVASCGVCKEEYGTSAHPLTEPIDVYSDWIDACERANEEEAAVGRRRSRYADEDDDNDL
ncbi:hypothetical protein ACP4OV_030507 [Aristida adscensionis]